MEELLSILADVGMLYGNVCVFKGIYFNVAELKISVLLEKGEVLLEVLQKKLGLVVGLEGLAHLFVFVLFFWYVLLLFCIIENKKNSFFFFFLFIKFINYILY